MAVPVRTSVGSGFSLVELLVVLAVIGILSALLLPAIQTVRDAARAAVCQSRLRGLTVSMTMFADENAGRFICARGGGGAAVATYQYSGWSWPSDLTPYVDSASTLADGGYGGWGSAGHFERVRQAMRNPAMRCPAWRGREDILGAAAAANAPAFDGGGFGINFVPGAPADMRHTALDWGNWGVGRHVWNLADIRQPARRAWLADNDYFLIGKPNLGPLGVFANGEFQLPTTWRALDAAANGGPRHRDRINIACFDGRVAALPLLEFGPAIGGGDARLAFMDPPRFRP